MNLNICSCWEYRTQKWNMSHNFFSFSLLFLSPGSIFSRWLITLTIFFLCLTYLVNCKHRIYRVMLTINYFRFINLISAKIKLKIEPNIYFLFEKMRVFYYKCLKPCKYKISSMYKWIYRLLHVV